MATGWLGWSPESAWKATIPEILVAMDTRLEIQNAQLPKSDKQGTGKQKEKPKPMGDFIAKVIQMPGTKVHGRK